MTPAEQRPATYVPTDGERKTIREVLSSFDEMRKVRERPLKLLGDRTMKRYWDEQEKRAVAYCPLKDIDSEDWKSNVVLGLTRNAILNQMGKTGLRVPECRIQSLSRLGFVDDERSRIWQNAYRWSLRRENADYLQQYVSLGLYVRGNACLYEGFEDTETELEMVDSWDESTGEVRTSKGKVTHWGPRRRIVPLDEIYYPNVYLNNLKEQSEVIWSRIEDYESLRPEFGKYANWKHVRPGTWSLAYVNDPFFRPRENLRRDNQVHVLRRYGNPHRGGKDRMTVMVGGVPLYDKPLPFNHKRPPFSWTLNEPFSDSFMLGCGVPFKMLDQQDMADGVMNSAMDKNLLAMNRPVMTDDPDVRISNMVRTGDIMRFTPGSKWEIAPLEGVTSSEFNFLQLVVQQAKEFSGAFGGGNAMTANGGKVTARQAVMLEDEVKRGLSVSMTNLENLERDLCVMRLSNLRQHLPGSGRTVLADESDLSEGRKGRFVMFLAKDMREALRMEAEEGRLSAVEVAGEKAGQPTEAVALSPEWFDYGDELEASCQAESAYSRNSTLELALSDERLAMLVNIKAVVPELDVAELLKDNMRKHGEDSEKYLSAPQASPVPPAGAMPTPEMAAQLGQGKMGAGQLIGTS